MGIYRADGWYTWAGKLAGDELWCTTRIQCVHPVYCGFNRRQTGSQSCDGAGCGFVARGLSGSCQSFDLYERLLHDLVSVEGLERHGGKQCRGDEAQFSTRRLGASPKPKGVGDDHAGFFSIWFRVRRGVAAVSGHPTEFCTSSTLTAQRLVLCRGCFANLPGQQPDNDPLPDFADNCDSNLGAFLSRLATLGQ